ncbi:MAG: hypothetical protein JNK58_03410 [Phycisphaerae bacterium]|nr:hypothetical protein [Phycisphaerae bacterium]
MFDNMPHKPNNMHHDTADSRANTFSGEGEMPPAPSIDVEHGALGSQPLRTLPSGVRVRFSDGTSGVVVSNGWGRLSVMQSGRVRQLPHSQYGIVINIIDTLAERHERSQR